MVTFFNYLKSMHKLKVPSLLFTNITEENQGDTPGCIYPFFKIYSSYICNSSSFGVIILYGVLDTREIPGIKLTEKSICLFSVNPNIPLNISSLLILRGG
jgi:hypothetical protein